MQPEAFEPIKKADEQSLIPSNRDEGTSRVDLNSGKKASAKGEKGTGAMGNLLVALMNQLDEKEKGREAKKSGKLSTSINKKNALGVLVSGDDHYKKLTRVIERKDSGALESLLNSQVSLATPEHNPPVLALSLMYGWEEGFLRLAEAGAPIEWGPGAGGEPGELAGIGTRSVFVKNLLGYAAIKSSLKALDLLWDKFNTDQKVDAIGLMHSFEAYQWCRKKDVDFWFTGDKKTNFLYCALESLEKDTKCVAAQNQISELYSDPRVDGKSVLWLEVLVSGRLDVLKAWQKAAGEVLTDGGLEEAPATLVGPKGGGRGRQRLSSSFWVGKGAPGGLRAEAYKIQKISLLELLCLGLNRNNESILALLLKSQEGQEALKASAWSRHELAVVQEASRVYKKLGFHKRPDILETLRTCSEETPLHRAVRRHEDLREVKALMSMCPQWIVHKDSNGKMPVDYANEGEEKRAVLESRVLEKAISQNPESTAGKSKAVKVSRVSRV